MSCFPRFRFTSIALAALVCASPTAAIASAPLGNDVRLQPLRDIERRILAPPDFARIAAEDASRDTKDEPLRYAIPHPVDVTPADAGTWEQLGTMSVWRYRIVAKGMASLNFGFTRFHLPQGASLYIGSADGRQIAGPYGAEHNAAHGQLWTPIIAADDVVIELDVPTNLRDLVELRLGSINPGYRGMGLVADGYAAARSGAGACKDANGRSENCNTDVACLDADDPWNGPRHAVGGVSSGGSLFCSGSLVNNTAADQRMLFMTADHCGVHPASLVVYWEYEWPTCRRPGASDGESVNPPDPNLTSSGAALLAAIPGQDITLVELSQPADPAFNLYWAGWDRSSEGAHCSAPADPSDTAGLCASIHHPSGNEKRITFSETDLVTGDFNQWVGQHWLARWDPSPPELPAFPPGGGLPISGTEGGSSGSPLYTPAQRLVGVLTGGSSYCGGSPSQQYDYYGKLVNAWDGSAPGTRLRDHLDPLGSDATGIYGADAVWFRLSASPAATGFCASDASAALDIRVDPWFESFPYPVALDVSGEPGGSSAIFSPPDVVPPGNSTLTLGDLGAAAPGEYTMTVTGTSGAEFASVDLSVTLDANPPDATSLLAPVDGDSGQAPRPILEWSANGVAIEYRVEVATDSAFGDIVFDATVAATSVEVYPPLPINATYYWRVIARNHCGDGVASAAYRFRVVGADPIFAHGFEAWTDPDIVESGPIGHPLSNSHDGTSIRWISGEIVDDDPQGWDVDFWNGNGGGLSVWWDYSPSVNAGVAPAADSPDLSVLASGATIGRDSTFSRRSGGMATWRAGASGYLGFRFDCSALPSAPPVGICYGYLALDTTGPGGYPATVVGYAYNRAGDAITIP